ncbi:MAG: 5-formyltetrahydrofolate cyclo-ligase [Spirochaetia bacterium]|nr:5-formyltetrahydrofolate cyclo-ligase [Spirochaetia bacterium]
MDQTDKRALRRAIRAKLESLPASRFEEAGRAIGAALSGLASYRNAKVVLAFLPMPREIDTVPLVESALADGKIVGVPRIEGDGLAFVRLDRHWREWPRDRFGIPEPPSDAPSLRLDELAAGPTLVVAPGLAFDRTGGRLGRGKGYYDRFLASLEAPSPGPGAVSVVGICLDEQLVGSVPVDERDRGVDAVISA